MDGMVTTGAVTFAEAVTVSALALALDLSPPLVAGKVFKLEVVGFVLTTGSGLLT